MPEPVAKKTKSNRKDNHHGNKFDENIDQQDDNTRSSTTSAIITKVPEIDEKVCNMAFNNLDRMLILIFFVYFIYKDKKIQNDSIMEIDQ